MHQRKSSIKSFSSFLVKLLVEEISQQVHVQLERSLEEMHELMSLVLGLQEIVDWN